ncbi:hypothetical protein J1N35_031473 [Gossypium stocksii]|uniref:Myb/SANT-like domain-containing protein n=1 Tax=Gossypium stocksii TaxID=47602 RepID=A0A9D3ZTS2_9ROSI|nr:hypothetical protein J1N35_031473 [Gossypium stocksii]
MVKTRKFVEGDSTLATKAIWDDELTLIFCELCVNEVNAGNRPTTHLNSKGWENVIALFQAKTQKNYGKPQLKNKWDTLKKEWRLWRELLKESTGIGWCPSKKTVDATEEWWAEKIQENPDFKGFKKKGIEPRLNDLMWQMFGGIVATGENAWAPSSGVIPSGVPMGDDTPDEGFGDSDENSNENESIPSNEVPSNPPRETPNRRKETLRVVHGKGKKSSSSRKSSRDSLATHIEKLCESMASPRKSVNEIVFPHSEYTISNAMDALRDLGDEIPKKDELYYFAIKMFQIPVKRKMLGFGGFDVNMLNKIQLHHFILGSNIFISLPTIPSITSTISSLELLLLWMSLTIYNSFYMNYNTPELSEEAQRRIATIVTQVEHNNYHEEEEQVLSTVLVHHETYFTMQPCMDSNYTGQMWVDEVLNGHDDRCMNSFRMPKNIFHSLLHDLQTNYGLKHGKVSAMEKLALSLYILGHRESNSNAAERFQRSGETVSRIFTDMLHTFARMEIDTIKPTEGQFEEVPNHIRHDTRYWPHFKDCIGAIDGTHIKACISPSCQIPYIGRKGEPTQNIMAVCDFNMCFIFAFPGWEGTAHDSRIFLQALRKQELKFPHPPPGKYYLVDSGYPQMAGFLGPYRGNDIIYLTFAEVIIEHLEKKKSLIMPILRYAL